MELIYWGLESNTNTSVAQSRKYLTVTLFIYRVLPQGGKLYKIFGDNSSDTFVPLFYNHFSGLSGKIERVPTLS